MNRVDLQHLCELRLREAKTLLDAGEASGAYYLAGYAVECALKACIAQKFKEHEFPDKSFVNSVYSHNLQDLLKHAGLASEPEIAPESRLWDQWSIVKAWNETKRYEETSEKQAQEIYWAIADSETGVLQWLKKRW
ncbi:MAG: HEPN domain-containing protein [Candidatus Acidiferrales bacterium]